MARANATRTSVGPCPRVARSISILPAPSYTPSVRCRTEFPARYPVAVSTSTARTHVLFFGPSKTALSACPHLESSRFLNPTLRRHDMGEPLGNLLLDTLTPEMLRALDPHEEDHPIGIILIRPDEVPQPAFFPPSAAV